MDIFQVIIYQFLTQNKTIINSFIYYFDFYCYSICNFFNIKIDNIIHDLIYTKHHTPYI